jgi:uncharacterized protein with FMN-binding domain
MRRAVTAVLGAVAVAMPAANALGAPPKKTTVTRQFVGPAAQADRWGDVQVTITVRKTTALTRVKGTKKTTKKVTRRVTDLTATYPDHTRRSVYINEQAIPILRSEALQAQSARIQLLSGATATSYAFAESLQAAIAQALAA